MTCKDKSLEWLQWRTEEHRSGKNSVGDLVEELERDGKLGFGFIAVDKLEEVNTGDGTTPRPTYISSDLTSQLKEDMRSLVQEFADCFTREYTEMPGLSRELVEHKLPIKRGFKPYK
jgi:hypothetical protein